MHNNYDPVRQYSTVRFCTVSGDRSKDAGGVLVVGVLAVYPRAIGLGSGRCCVAAVPARLREHIRLRRRRHRLDTGHQCAAYTYLRSYRQLALCPFSSHSPSSVFHAVTHED